MQVPVTTTAAGQPLPEAPTSLRVNLSVLPAEYFAATSARLVDRGSSAVITYLCEDGRPKGPPLGFSIVLAPVALAHFVERADALIAATPQLSGLKRLPKKRLVVKTWQLLMPPRGAVSVVHARVNDLIGTDYYLVTPRAFALAAEATRANPGSNLPPVNADPVITCALDVWQFLALVDEARVMASAKLRKLGAEGLVPKVEGQ